MHYQPQPELLHNRIILVTGAGDGIGREAALTYARHGAQLILLGRTLSKLQAVKQEIHQLGLAPAATVEFDLLTAAPADYQKLADELAAAYPHLDGVLNNAGLLGTINPLAEQDYQEFCDVMQVNVNASLLLTQAVLPLLLKSPSASLIFTSSSVGRTGRAGWGLMLFQNLLPKA